MDPHRRRKRKREPHAARPRTAIMSLGDDLIIEILLRLPSPASLARASLTCARWRRLATSRHFLLSFGALHPSPPLLGCFVSCAGAAIPAFHRAQICLERDLAAAVRGGDFLLTGMEERKWSLSDCRHGLLLLTSTDHKLALFNPLYRRGRLDIRRPLSFSCGRNQSLAADCLLPAACSAEDSRVSSFRLVSLDNGGQRVRAQVYDSHTGKWRCHPWAPPSIRPPAPRRGVQDESPFPSMQAAGRIYWKYARGSVLLSLDTAPGAGGSMELAHVALPPVPTIYKAPASYVVGDTEGGACCLVCVAPPAASAGGPALQVWLRNEDTDSWELETKVQEARFLNACGEDRSNKVRQICAVTAGVVLLCLDRGPGRCRYLAFRLKNLHAGLGLALTPKSKLPLEADFITCRGLTAKPYLMAWPPSTLLH